jgi:hypothetical protein
MNDEVGKAAKYRERAAEMRSLAGNLKNEQHKRLVLKAAENYENMAENAEQETARRSPR